MDRRTALQLLISGVSTLPSLASLSLIQRTALADELHATLSTQDDAYVPRALTGRQFELVTRMVDLILPATDTPGATAVGVHRFIDLLLAQSLLESDRQALADGLVAIDEKCRLLHGAGFLESGEARQLALLVDLDAQANALEVVPAHLAARAATGAARPVAVAGAVQAFSTLKQLTLHGYFNSETVMSRILHAPIIPGRFEGCVPIQSV